MSEKRESDQVAAGSPLTALLANAATREEAARALVAREDATIDRQELETLRRALAQAPVLTLYVPAPLTSASIAEIAAWCRHEIDPELLLDVRIDRMAAGGCVFAWRGVLHDFSLAHFIRRHKDEYEASLARILGVAAPA